MADNHYRTAAKAARAWNGMVAFVRRTGLMPGFLALVFGSGFVWWQSNDHDRGSTFATTIFVGAIGIVGVAACAFVTGLFLAPRHLRREDEQRTIDARETSAERMRNLHTTYAAGHSLRSYVGNTSNQFVVGRATPEQITEWFDSVEPLLPPDEFARWHAQLPSAAGNYSDIERQFLYRLELVRQVVQPASA